MKLLDDVHTCEQLAEGTYRIDEAGIVNCYLLIGRKTALLIDSGCGAGSLAACVHQLTDKPVLLALTHRHPDHAGGAWQFGAYYASAADCTPLYDLMCLPAVSEKMVKAAGKEITRKPPLGVSAKQHVLKVSRGFDLGGRQIRILETPGHTKGSVVYYEEASRQMFTGDDINPCLWMHLPGCTSLREWKPGAGRIIALMRQGYTAWYGHGDGRQPLEQMLKTYEIAEELIAAKQTGTLPKGKFLYPHPDQYPNIYCSSKKIL